VRCRRMGRDYIPANRDSVPACSAVLRPKGTRIGRDSFPACTTKLQTCFTPESNRGRDSIPTSSIAENPADVTIVQTCPCAECVNASVRLWTRSRERKSRRGNAAHAARIARDRQVHRRRAAQHAPGTLASESSTGESGTGEFACDEGQRLQVFHATLRGLRLIYFGHVRRRTNRRILRSTAVVFRPEVLRWPPLERRWATRPPWSRPCSANASWRPPPNPPWPRRCAGSRSA